MSQVLSLIEIGSKATVDRGLVRDRIPQRLNELLSIDPVGTVVDYKMTDGMGIGFVLRLSDGSINWFFEEELVVSNQSSSSFSSKEIKNEVGIFHDEDVNLVRKQRFRIQTSAGQSYNIKKIPELLNPLTFAKWLFYSLRDVY